MAELADFKNIRIALTNNNLLSSVGTNSTLDDLSQWKCTFEFLIRVQNGLKKP